MKDTMVDEGCPNTEDIPKIDLDIAAPTIVGHQEIDELVKRFSQALREKLIASEAKYGWQNGWLEDDWQRQLQNDIREHIDKGDPRDVAAYCAFAWHHNWSLKRSKATTAKEDVQHYDLMTVRPYLKTLNARLTRRRYAKTTLREYLQQIQPVELAEQYLIFYDKYPFHKEVCAGAKHHHWWVGGLEEHLCEMIGIGLDIMDLYAGDFTFSKSDLIISIFLHDFSKIWTYKYITKEDKEKNPKKYKEQQIFTYTDGQYDILNDEAKILLELGRAGIIPTNEQWSAVLFAEGGFSQAMYDFGGRSQAGQTVYARNHLATFVSLLDQWSAAILGKSII